ncbi:acid phosphatase 1-like [Melia azedarach]|uniref:Acid phosphatase 1-like n=1 Tax=Melia azedarach TaxID=155640 RepID=A0ACC1Y2R0_MELAZ|nr:acid phosphatase 1-like [Melia azedarach]
MVTVLSIVVSLAIILATSYQVSGLQSFNLIRQPVAPREHFWGFSCQSWRLGVETNNIRDWTTVPKLCEIYMAVYLLGPQYRKDSRIVTYEAFRYAESLELGDDGKDIWIFDIDETSLSHLFFIAQYGFGTEPLNGTAFLEWLEKGEAPALPESLKLYRRLLNLGIKTVFLTGRAEFMRNSTESNLKLVGYDTWEKVLLRNSSELNQTQVEYKSIKRTELVESGYRIVGNIGDQWSDLLGAYPGSRTFKLPNPMYYAE